MAGLLAAPSLDGVLKSNRDGIVNACQMSVRLGKPSNGSSKLLPCINDSNARVHESGRHQAALNLYFADLP